MNTLIKGRFGERVAYNFVKAKGMEVLAVNYRTGPYELDIVAKEGEELVFIEVKRRKDSSIFTVNEAISWAKRTALVKAANRFLLEMDLVHLTGRFDVIYLAEQKNGSFCLYHIENAFY